MIGRSELRHHPYAPAHATPDDITRLHVAVLRALVVRVDDLPGPEVLRRRPPIGCNLSVAVPCCGRAYVSSIVLPAARAAAGDPGSSGMGEVAGKQLPQSARRRCARSCCLAIAAAGAEVRRG